MTELQQCPPHDLLITALYGEAAADEMRGLEAHLAACAACRDEWDGLRGVRSVLREWEAPDVPLHVRIAVTEGHDTAVVPARSTRSPLGMYATAGLAAAATLVLGLAAGLANLNVRIDGTGVTFSTGRGGEARAATSPLASAPAMPAAATADPAATATAATAPWRSELVALEQRLRNELAARPGGATVVNAAADARPNAAIFQTVQSMIDEAETRQQRALAVRFTELMRDVDAQRRTDLVNIQNGFGQIEGRTAVEAARSQEMMNYLYRVSTQQPPR